MNKPLHIFGLLCLLVTSIAAQNQPLRIGIIGCDTSHVTAFTQMLNDEKREDYVAGARVVAAFKGGSPDIESSRTRIEGFTQELEKKWGVEIVPSIEKLCEKVDAVLLESVDGRPHLQQIRPVLMAHKPVFIDKPFAGNIADVLEIARLAKETGTPVFSSSSLRYLPEVKALRGKESLGTITGAISYSPSPTEPHHPDLFWYGIHGVEILFTLMGPGCQSVSRINTPGTDVVSCVWKDGRIGSFRGIREGKQKYGAVLFGKNDIGTTFPEKIGYRDLVVEIVKFFKSGVSPVSIEETIEIYGFMQAAELSKARNGATVSMSEVLKSK